MVITRDMGPLLIAGYGAGAFVAASVAMWWYQRTGATGFAYALAIVLFARWIVATTAALFELGSIDDVTAARLENVAAPLASANDQLALVTWFQRAAPERASALGDVPWCGFGAAGTCAGVPAQIQSDYTFTALVGTFGWTGAWAMTLGCVVWLHAVVRSHARVTRGEPRLLRIAGRVVNDDQAFLSWLSVTWVVLALCQLAVTVAGNLAVIPADRRHVSVRELRHDVACRQHGDARASPPTSTSRVGTLMREAAPLTLLQLAITASIAVVPVLLGVLVVVAGAREPDTAKPARNSDRHVSVRHVAALKTFERAIVRRDANRARCRRRRRCSTRFPQCRAEWDGRGGR